MIFRSDNTAGASPAVIAALARANCGYEASYGDDVVTSKLEQSLSDIFERQVHLLMCTSGTAANAIGLASVTPSYGHCYCHELAHIRVDECNAVPMVSGGANLWPVSGDDAKIDLRSLENAIGFVDGSVHMGKPSSLGITQATERGTIYSLDEIANLSQLAHSKGLKTHVDGARFANALVALDCTPAEMSWKAGIDLLTFGSAKNGTFSAEALLFFDTEPFERASYLHKRMAQLSSKMRFQSAQMQAYLQDDLWLNNARHANAMATRLANGIVASGLGELDHPVDVNMLFWRVSEAINEHLISCGHDLGHHKEGDDVVLRLVCAFNTSADDVDAFLGLLSSLLPENARRAS